MRDGVGERRRVDALVGDGLAHDLGLVLVERHGCGADVLRLLERVECPFPPFGGQRVAVVGAAGVDQAEHFDQALLPRPLQELGKDAARELELLFPLPDRLDSEQVDRLQQEVQQELAAETRLFDGFGDGGARLVVVSRPANRVQVRSAHGSILRIRVYSCPVGPLEPFERGPIEPPRESATATGEIDPRTGRRAGLPARAGGPRT